jgi:Protein of unknown function (DUF1598)
LLKVIVFTQEQRDSEVRSAVTAARPGGPNMSRRPIRSWYWLCALIFALAAASVAPDHASAQVQQPPLGIGNTIIARQVGGVLVNVDGVLNNVDLRGRKELAELRRKALARVPVEMSGATELRMISLRALDEEVSRLLKNNQPLTDEMRYLAGLQRLQYVFVDAENHDIVLAGPAEGWKVDELGNVVGATTGQPVLQLDDLVVALRSADEARNGGISCSIDPTTDGMQRLQQYLRTKTTIGNPSQTLHEYEVSLGPQQISVTGVPASSRFASVLVAADYRMKRLAMKMDEPPVRGLPSYLDMATPGGSMTPRWWLSPNYEALYRDAEGLAWELRGIGVKCLTAEDTFNTVGQRTQTRQASPIAQRWADNMTAKYEDLAAKEPIFAELRNCIDLAVVSALILKENLTARAGCELPALLGEKRYAVAQFNVPKQVDSRATAVKKGRNWVITASGGVMIQPWELIQTAKASDKVALVRSKSVAARQHTWWWN